MGILIFQRVEKPCQSEPVRTLLRAKSRRTAAVALCTRLRAQWRGNLLDFRIFISGNRQIFLLFRGLPHQWCSAQRIKNINDCQWQSYNNVLRTGSQ